MPALQPIALIAGDDDLAFVATNGEGELIDPDFDDELSEILKLSDNSHIIVPLIAVTSNDIGSEA